MYGRGHGDVQYEVTRDDGPGPVLGLRPGVRDPPVRMLPNWEVIERAVAATGL